MVMVPGLGDDIQAIKAGVMEIGDVFAVNKADRDGAKRTAREIDMMLDFNTSDWRPPVQMVIAIDNKGVEELIDAVKKAPCLYGRNKSVYRTKEKKFP